MLAPYGGSGVYRRHLVIVLLFVMTGCASASSSPTLVVNGTGPRTTAAGTARFREVVTATGSTASTYTGQIDFRSHLAETEAAEPSQSATKSTISHVIWSGSTVYIASPPQADAPAPFAGKSWVGYHLRTLPFPGKAAEVIGAVTSLFPLQFPLTSAGLDPSIGVGAFGSITTAVSAAGSMTLDGVPTTRYLLTLSTAKAESYLDSLTPSTAIPATALAFDKLFTRFILDGLRPSHQITLYIDGDGRTRRLAVVDSVSLPNEPPTSFSETIDYSAFGVPVTIAVPPPDQVAFLQS